MGRKGLKGKGYGRVKGNSGGLKGKWEGEGFKGEGEG